MSKFERKANLSEYPIELLSDFTEDYRLKMVEKAIDNKDYSGLSNLILAFKEPFQLIYKALYVSDIEALKIISKHKNFEQSVSWIPVLHKAVYDDSDSEINILAGFAYDSKDAIKGDIFKFLMNAKKGEFIAPDLQLMSFMMDKAQFDEFCAKKEINLSDEKYKDLDFAHYTLMNEKPLYSLVEGAKASVVDIILSKTYSKDLSEEQVRKIYENLHTLDPISKEMMNYLALKIFQGDSIKIQFVADANGYYAPYLNLINIGTHFLQEKIFNIDSVVIHEIGHYFYHKLFDNKVTPFRKIKSEDASVIKNISESIVSPNNLHPITDVLALFELLRDGDLIKKAFSTQMQYENAARKPVYEAAKLLGFDTAEMDKAKFTSEYTEFFKEKSIIDIFYLNHADIFKMENNNVVYIPPKVLDNLFGLYATFAHDNICKKYEMFEMTQDNMKEWALKTFLPYVVEELKLTPKHIHFLERIADYVNRGEGIGGNDKQKYQELIVRYAEFKAAGLDQEILDSFDELVQYHHEQASPIVEKEIAEYKLQCCELADNTSACISDL